MISEFEDGKTFITVLKQGDRLKKGSEVIIITVNGKKHIRTDNENKASDDLVDVHEFK